MMSAAARWKPRPMSGKPEVMRIYIFSQRRCLKKPKCGYKACRSASTSDTSTEPLPRCWTSAWCYLQPLKAKNVSCCFPLRTRERKLGFWELTHNLHGRQREDGQVGGILEGKTDQESA